jgi:hypothetical protein
MATRIITGSAATNTTTLTIPAGSNWKVLWMTVVYTSGAAVGNRQLRGKLTTAADVEIRDIHAGAVQAASLVRHYEFLPGTYRETAFIDGSIQIPFPTGFVLPAGYKMVIYDSTNVSAADTITYSMQVELVD